MKLCLAISLLACSSMLAVSAASWAADTQPGVVRIGFITDISGTYGDNDGQGGVEAIKMAIADFGALPDGKRIELVVADHQNKADIAASKAREWFDTQDVNMIIGGTNSGAALAMANVAREKKKLFIAVGAATSALTNEQCSPYTIHWAYDTAALGKGTGKAVVKAGGKSWYFLAVDQAFGRALQDDTAKVVQAAGGTIVGSVNAPLNASDYSSFMLQAMASKADILGLANAGGDLIASIKTAHEFGVTKKMQLAGLLMFINDVHAVGLEAAQGMYLTDGWYWNQNQETTAWSRRYFEKVKSMPNVIQAGNYSATTQYLKAVAAVGTADPDKVLAHLRNEKVNDMFAKDGYIRPDGRMVHDMYLVQIKSPEQSTEPWDYYNLVETIKGEDAFTTKAESLCPLWK
ncbi:ABC transporter substrate-binding protein [Pusillimonas noertemannii]|uniref:ABC transporter substrate-binding protein n=1 Tax=Pusillimonas noertemannii TaxID=305977 RepID=UPI003341558D